MTLINLKNLEEEFFPVGNPVNDVGGFFTENKDLHKVYLEQDTKLTIMVNERLRFSITDTIATLKLFSAMADSFKKFSRDIYMPPAEEYRIYL